MGWLVSLLSLCATIASVLLFISPLEDVQKAKTLRSTRGQSSFPFICMWVNCCLWVMYGVQTHVFTVLLVNGTGCLLSAYYSVIFFEVSNGVDRVKIFLSMLAAITFVTWAAYSQFYAMVFDSNFIGWMATAVCVIMFASPLIVVQNVVSSKNSGFLNFRLSVMGVINCLAWAGLGIIYFDMFMIVPNVLGLFLSLLQIGLFMKYPAKPLGPAPTLPI